MTHTDDDYDSKNVPEEIQWGMYDNLGEPIAETEIMKLSDSSSTVKDEVITYDFGTVEIGEGTDGGENGNEDGEESGNEDGGENGENPDEKTSAARSQLIQNDALDSQLSVVAGSSSFYPDGTREDCVPLDVDVLRLLKVPGISVPLVRDSSGNGLINFDNAGALNSYSHAPVSNRAVAAAGAVGRDGSINVDGISDGSYGSVNVDLIEALRHSGSSTLNDGVVDELSIEFGAIASRAVAKGSETSSDYVVSDGRLHLSSPMLAQVHDDLDQLVDSAGDRFENTIINEGIVETITEHNRTYEADELKVRIDGVKGYPRVEFRDALNSVVEWVMNQQFEDRNGIVSIDLMSNEIEVDLSKVVKGENGEDLNGLDPNTEIFTAETMSTVQRAIADALNSVVGTVEDELQAAFQDVRITISLDASVLGAVGSVEANGIVTVDATVAQLTGIDYTPLSISTDMSVSGVSGERLMAPVSNELADELVDATSSIVSRTLSYVSSEVAAELDYGSLVVVGSYYDDLFNNLNMVAELTINEQPQKSLIDSDEGPGFTVNAVSIELSPDAGGEDINLASSSVRASD